MPGTLEERHIDQCCWSSMSGKENGKKVKETVVLWIRRTTNNCLAQLELPLLCYSCANRAFWHLWDLVIGGNIYSPSYHVSIEWRVVQFCFPGVSNIEVILKHGGWLCQLLGTSWVGKIDRSWRLSLRSFRGCICLCLGDESTWIVWNIHFKTSKQFPLAKRLCEL